MMNNEKKEPTLGDSLRVASAFRTLAAALNYENSLKRARAVLEEEGRWEGEVADRFKELFKE